jgi:uncharacterized protein YdaU (DUF1376 family)
MHYYQFNIGDYIKQTIHLTLWEDLTYRRLLDLYYDTEKPIPNDIPWVSRRIRMDIENVETILKEFFELTDEGYRNRRADREIASYHAFLEKQRANGSKGGRPKKPMGIPDLTQDEPKKTLNTNHKPITNKQSKKTLCTLEEYINQCKQEGKAVIPEDDKVFEFATNANIPLEFLRIAWVAFRDEHLEKGDKKQADWVQTFRNYVRNDYVKVWAFNKDGECYLTTKGKQIASDMEKRENGRA